MTETLPSRELEELRRRFKPGYSVEATKGGHFTVVDPDGNKVRNENGMPLTLASTPHGGRQTKNAEAELKRAGVLRGPGRPSKPREPVNEARKTQAEAGRKTQSALAKRRSEEAVKLREDLEVLLHGVGGFDNYGNLADLAEIGSYIAREKGDPTLTPDLLKHSIARVKSDHPIDDRYRAIWLELVERLRQSDKATTEYFVLLRNAKGIPDPNSLLPTQLQFPMAGEWPFAVQLLNISKCFADHSYQRPAQWSFVRDKAQRFDPTLVGAIDVSDRGGRFAIMDGQQRFEIMRLIGKETVWAAVYVGLDLSAESWFFIHKNKDRKNILPMHIFKARVTAGEPDAVEINRTVTKNGYRLEIGAAGALGQDREKNIASVAALEAAFQLGVLDRTLATMADSTLGLRQGNSAHVLSGVSLTLSTWPHLDDGVLKASLAGRGPEWLITKSYELGSNTGANTRAKAMRAAIMGEYNRLLGRERQAERLRVTA